MLYVDGLWASRMVIHIYRDGSVPIPKGMREGYIKVELSPQQMNAVAAVLGLGYRDGEILYYKDEDIDDNIMRTDGLGIRAQYYALNCEARKQRISQRVNNSLVNSAAADSLSVRKDENGVFDFVMKSDDIVPPPSGKHKNETIIEYTDDDYIDVPESFANYSSHGYI